MKMYDEIISNIISLCTNAGAKSLGVDENPKWPDAGNMNMILRGDMAFELGGSDGFLPAVGGTAVTDEESLVGADEILLVGKDLNELSGDAPYARVALVRVNSDAMGEGNKLYNAIRKIEYVRYHVSPEGFMMRVSSTRERESVRVSKTAIQKGITFKDVGSLMLKRYHENPSIEAVKLIFVTDKNFDFKALDKEIHGAEDITKTIDHILKNVMIDCDACSMQELCNEIEGMKEMHMAQMSQE